MMILNKKGVGPRLRCIIRVPPFPASCQLGLLRSQTAARLCFPPSSSEALKVSQLTRLLHGKGFDFE